MFSTAHAWFRALDDGDSADKGPEYPVELAQSWPKGCWEFS